MNQNTQDEVKKHLVQGSFKQMVESVAEAAGLPLHALNDLSRILDTIALSAGTQSKEIRVYVDPIADGKGGVDGYTAMVVASNWTKSVGFLPIEQLFGSNAHNVDKNLHLDSARSYWDERWKRPDAVKALNGGVVPVGVPS